MVDAWWLVLVPLALALGWLKGSMREMEAHTRTLQRHIEFMREMWPDEVEDDVD